MPGSPDGTETEVKTEVEVQDAKAQAPDPSAEATDGDKSEKSMLDAVQDALKPKEESPASTKPDPDAAAKPSSESEAKSKADGENAEGEHEDDDFSEDELSQLAEKTQRRMRKLANDRKDLSSRVETLQPKAEQFDKILGFVSENRLSRDDINNTFRIAAMVRNDPAGALQALEPIVTELRRATGADLPKDLFEEVRVGRMTRDHAEELSRSRAANKLNDERNRQREEDDRLRSEHEGRANAAKSAAEAADNWYAEQQKTDPDFKLKQDRIADKAKLELISRNGQIPTVDETRRMLNDIKKSVDKEFGALRPAPKSVEPVNGHASTGTKTAPKTMLEAMERAISG